MTIHTDRVLNWLGLGVSLGAVEARVRDDQHILQQTYKGFARRPAKEIYPLFCWIADHNHAVFSFRIENQHGGYSGYGIVTEDPDLVSALHHTFDYYLSRASASATEINALQR